MHTRKPTRDDVGWLFETDTAQIRKGIGVRDAVVVVTADGGSDGGHALERVGCFDL